MDIAKAQDLEKQEAHQLLRVKLLNEQWCTNGTPEELAAHIIEVWDVSLGDYMGMRYSIEDVVAELSTPVVCESDDRRNHYLFEAGNFSYT